MATHEVTNQSPVWTGGNAWRHDPLLVQLTEDFDPAVRKELDQIGRFVLSAEAQETARIANTLTPVLRTHDRQGRLLETVAFARIDSRLAQVLLARADTAGRVAATHQALAEEVGTAREVVSRQLDALAKAGLVRTARGEVTLLDRAALEARGAL